MLTPAEEMLMNDNIIVINKDLIKILSFAEALILQRVHYYCNFFRNLKDERHFHNQYYWVYNTTNGWLEDIGYIISEKTLRRAISSLEEKCLLISDNFNKMKVDRTKWYRVHIDNLNLLIETWDYYGQPNSRNSKDDTYYANFMDDYHDNFEACGQNDRMQVVNMTGSHVVKMTGPITSKSNKSNNTSSVRQGGTENSGKKKLSIEEFRAQSEKTTRSMRELDVDKDSAIPKFASSKVKFSELAANDLARVLVSLVSTNKKQARITTKQYESINREVTLKDGKKYMSPQKTYEMYPDAYRKFVETVVPEGIVKMNKRKNMSNFISFLLNPEWYHGWFTYAKHHSIDIGGMETNVSSDSDNGLQGVDDKQRSKIEGLGDII